MGSGQPEHKQRLIGLARHRAFETYLRFGRMPERDLAPAEGKAIDPSAALPAPTRPTRFYPSGTYVGLIGSWGGQAGDRRPQAIDPFYL